jgi:hypothetical protein
MEIPKNEIRYNKGNICEVVTYNDANGETLIIDIYSLENGTPMIKHFERNQDECDIKQTPIERRDIPDGVLEILRAKNREGVEFLRERGKIEEFVDT